MLERNMLRENIIDKLYDVLDSVVNRTINKEQSFGVVLTLDDDPYASGNLGQQFDIHRRKPTFLEPVNTTRCQHKQLAEAHLSCLHGDPLQQDFATR